MVIIRIKNKNTITRIKYKGINTKRNFTISISLSSAFNDPLLRHLSEIQGHINRETNENKVDLVSKYNSYGEWLNQLLPYLNPEMIQLLGRLQGRDIPTWNYMNIPSSTDHMTTDQINRMYDLSNNQLSSLYSSIFSQANFVLAEPNVRIPLELRAQGNTILRQLSALKSQREELIPMNEEASDNYRNWYNEIRSNSSESNSTETSNTNSQDTSTSSHNNSTNDSAVNMSNFSEMPFFFGGE